MIPKFSAPDLADFAISQYRKSLRLAWHYTELEKAIAIIKSGYLEPRDGGRDGLDLVWLTMNEFWEPSIYPHLDMLLEEGRAGLSFEHGKSFWLTLNEQHKGLSRGACMVKLIEEAGGGWVRFGYPSHLLTPVERFDNTAMLKHYQGWSDNNLFNFNGMKKDWRVSPRPISVKQIVAIEFMQGAATNWLWLPLDELPLDEPAPTAVAHA